MSKEQSVIQIESIKEFSEILKANTNKLVILDFYTDWCRPCQNLAPKLKNIATNNKNVIIVKANAEDDNLEKLVEKYQVRAFPTLIFFKQNNVIDNFSGADEQRIMSIVNSYA